jgi:D-beta-D-heptose 7-phosphate kinase/D-beta-D-heptose 1-phosphate adenosyltransferase
MALKPAHNGYERKILSSDELRIALDRDRRAGRRIVFTNGCFDLMHAGHLHLLGFAHAQGDVLVVGLNSDRSVRAIKGPDRPINHAGDRARMLAALELVDYVLVFDENRAERVIRTVRPDVLVKGEDYRGQVVDGQKFVESYGGQVVLAPLLEGHSTTATVARLRTGAAANVLRSRREPKSTRPH